MQGNGETGKVLEPVESGEIKDPHIGDEEEDILSVRPKGAPRSLRSYTAAGVMVELTRLRFGHKVSEVKKDYGTTLPADGWRYGKYRKVGQLLKDGGQKLTEGSDLGGTNIEAFWEALDGKVRDFSRFSRCGNEAIEIGNAIMEAFNEPPVIPIDGLLGLYLTDSKRVEIYTGAIKDVADELEIDPAGLERVVRIHEYAHAITHLGLDADGYYWNTEGFKRAEDALLEGLAHYYTFVAAYLDEPSRIPEFRKLLQNQGPEYRAFTSFCTEGLEKVRHAVVQIRQADEPATLEGFYGFLK